MKEFYAFMSKDFPEGDRIDALCVGYGVAQTCACTQASGDVLTRENIMKQAASLKDLLRSLLPGIKVNTSLTDFAPICVQLHRFKGEAWDLFGDVISADVGG